MSAPRRLVLIRHGSARNGAEGGDKARELTPDGLAEAAALGEWLNAKGMLGDAVLCSPALRTRQTWEAIVNATGHGALIEMESRLYEASAEDVLSLVRETDPLVRTLVVVAHAPAMPLCAALLSEGRGDHAAMVSLHHGFAPGSCAIVECEGSWADIAPGTGELVAVRSGAQ